MKTFATFVALTLTLVALADEVVVDDALLSKAEVVLRVKRLTSGEGDKYHWYRVEVLRVLKNQSGELFTGVLSVAAYSWEAGVPEGESTLYLERYNPEGHKDWKLLGGGAATGVSHVKPP